ncbi:MAG: maltose alpha-D-glucosyltransferase [Chloroflexota bacterium]
MNWYENAIFYELYPRAFSDGNGDGYGDFSGLRSRLDYLEWLGVDCIWMTPIYPSPLRDDGYDVASFLGVDPMYGLMEDFKLTVDEIHRRGMRIILDLVVNHTSDLHPWFVEARRSKDSALRDYYVWTSDPERYKDARIIFIDTEESNWAYDELSGEYYWHRFFSTQPDLNFDNPRVQEEMLKIISFWLDIGIDGFRVDAVPYLFEREGTNCENLPETHEFVKRMRRFVDERYPGTLLLAEANQWPGDLMPYFADGDEFHMCFHFPVMPRLFKALALADRTDVVEILANTPQIPSGCQWAIFLRNHDELTLEMVTEADRQFLWDFYAPEPRQRLNLGIRRRLAPLVEGDRRRIELMHSLLLTLPGAPVLYYGDEIGMGDNISLEDRNGVRTPMQWNDGENGGFSTAPLENLYAPPVSGPTYGYGTVNVLVQQITPNSLLHVVRSLIYARKSLAMLARGQLEWLEELPRQFLCFWRVNDEGRMLALHNLSDREEQIPLPAGFKYRDVLNEEATIDETEMLTLPPYGYRWLLPV